jgi:hypothetical protein
MKFPAKSSWIRSYEQFSASISIFRLEAATCQDDDWKKDFRDHCATKQGNYPQTPVALIRKMNIKLAQAKRQWSQKGQPNRQESSDQIGICVGRLPNIEDLVGSAENCCRIQNCVFSVQNCLSRLFHEVATGISQFDELVIALEEPETELALQLKNPFAESRLVDSQPFGSPREVQVFRQCNCRLPYSMRRSHLYQRRRVCVGRLLTTPGSRHPLGVFPVGRSTPPNQA